MNKYLIGLYCGAMTGGPYEGSFTDPYALIKANNKQDALNTFNDIYKCDYFYGEIIAEVQNNNLINIDENISVNKAKSIFRKVLNDGNSKPLIISKYRYNENTLEGYVERHPGVYINFEFLRNNKG